MRSITLALFAVFRLVGAKRGRRERRRESDRLVTAGTRSDNGRHHDVKTAAHRRPLPVAQHASASRRGDRRRAVETIVTGLRWRAIQEPLICRGEWREDFVDQCRELGTLMAAGLEAGVF
jgi:hypothetical protein